MKGADDPGEFDGRGNFGLDEGETTTAPAVEDVARPAAAYFSNFAVHFMQMLLYKDATSNSQNTINRLCRKQNTYISLRTPGFASVHELDPDAAFVSGAAKANPVGLRTAGMR